MRALLAIAVFALAGCQSAPRVQAPLLLHSKPMIVVRHNGGVQDGACPMWVKLNGDLKGELENGQGLNLDVEPGVYTVALGRSRGGVFGAGTVCVGSLQTTALITRSVEVGNKPVRLVYDMKGTGKRWIPIAGLFLAPTPVLDAED
jgi:hypothetical protein